MAMVIAGSDLGTECVKTVIVDGDGKVVGRATVPTRGYFQDCFQESMGAALDEAQVPVSALGGVCVTGFAASCAPIATQRVSETLCHARGAWNTAAPRGHRGRHRRPRPQGDPRRRPGRRAPRAGRCASARSASAPS